jgi:preprotein translocase subunit SecA
MIEITDGELRSRLRELAVVSEDLDWDDVVLRAEKAVVPVAEAGLHMTARSEPRSVAEAGFSISPGARSSRSRRPRVESRPKVEFKQLERYAASINEFEPALELESGKELRERYDRVRERAVDGESLDDLIFESFAVTREVAKRALGQRHLDVQLIGGMVVHDGSIAEMKPGEGKTLTATLPICLNALYSRNADGLAARNAGVHVVTANDYLAYRSAVWMKPIYDLLGISVGILRSDEREPDEKKAAYAADVTYGAGSEFGFDYLRDNMVTEASQRVQRGHGFAIVDDVDAVLIDEARTPLIISGQPERPVDIYNKFANLARVMEPGRASEGQGSKSMPRFDFAPDEKHKTVAPTERGVEKAERFLGIDNLYRAENGYLVNHLQQALKAESLYKRGVDYEVIDGEVKIIDEFTGRILDGRRWSEGLHQAIEAKEGVAIQEENQTVATITYQNYFRRYDKLGGMTGTAITEATEFMKIYELQVVEIPTNQPMIRADQNDKIYKTKDGKWAAVAKEIELRHHRGQPILVGTTSREASERLSKELRRSATQHTVLTGQREHAEREGEIIAEAGRPGAVTIATNPAGGGVDIKLGGNAEHLTEVALRGEHEPGTPEYDKAWDELFPTFEEQVGRDRETVMESGGLFILGTERHESRRIDNQLRGRAGRQGDPGESCFYLSAEDDLVRLFAGDRIYRILDKLGPVDDEGEEEPIEAKMLSEQIENAQKKVEEQNFLIRKRVLEYDDVMNQQREIVYEYRDRILEDDDMSDTAREQLAGVVERIAGEYLQGEFPEKWDLQGLYTQLKQMYPVGIDLEDLDVENINRERLIRDLREGIVDAYGDREEELGPELMRALERFMLLQTIDERWREHLHDMDYLREGIHLRGFAQIDPLVAYKNEGFEMFTALMNSIWEEFARYIYVVEVETEGET